MIFRRAQNLLGTVLGMALMSAMGGGVRAAQDPAVDPVPPAQPASQQRLYFSALDKQELPVLGLEAGNFALRIDGLPAALGNFQPGRPYSSRSIPLVAWILVDFNPHINATMIANQAEAAAGALDQMHPASALGVKLISDREETLAPLGHDADALRKAFQDFKVRRSQLKVFREQGTTLLGPGGLVRAVELSLGELDDYVNGQPELSGKEVLRSMLVLSDANINPSYSRRPAIEEAVGRNVFVYPVFIPRTSFGRWVEDYFQLARQTGGVGMVFGAIRPGSDLFNLPRENRDANALMFSILNMLRDLNGKYSFSVDLPPTGRTLKLDLRCLRSGVSIRLLKRQLP